MKIWLSKSSEVPIQEQLRTQLILGIVSGDLSPGERLPSTSQLARQFHLHPNTVRAAYRELARERWIEWRRGSGFYVRALDGMNKTDPAFNLDQLISTFFNVARTRGYSLTEIQSRITRWFSVQPPDHILVVEPEPELREILVAEVADKINIPVQGAGIDECSDTGKLLGAVCVALYDHAEQVRSALPAEAARVFLHSSSIPKTLSQEPKPRPDTLFTVISRWPKFLQWARTTLVAIGIDPSALDLRDARQKGWQRGLTRRSFIITDSLMAGRMPDGCRPRVFPIIADESLAELREQLPL